MAKTKFVYRFDDNGYLVGPTLVQQNPRNNNAWMIPEDCTEVEPLRDKLEAHFARFQDGQWQYEEIPQDAGFFVGKKISHKSQKLHDQVLRSLLQKLVNEKPDTYRIIRGSEEEGLWWSVEQVPEKTETEKALESKQSQMATLKSNLYKTDYVASKIAEGAATKEEYADILSQRQEWRGQINELEAEISSLKGE